LKAIPQGILDAILLDAIPLDATPLDATLLDAILAPGRAAPQGKRITFLWSTSSVPTSGNPAVKRPRSAKSALLPDFTGKCDSGMLAGDASLRALLLHCDRLRIMV
jgi:hypothetical protein